MGHHAGLARLMDTIYHTPWLRVVSHGSTLDGYKNVEILQDGAWILSKRFDESDDYMISNLMDYIIYLKDSRGQHRQVY